jgi:hypothetical protein
MILIQWSRVVASGILLGIVGAWFAARYLATAVVGLPPVDAVSLVAVPLMLGFVSLAACHIAARRATHGDLAGALRQE